MVVQLKAEPDGFALLTHSSRAISGSSNTDEERRYVKPSQSMIDAEFSLDGPHSHRTVFSKSVNYPSAVAYSGGTTKPVTPDALATRLYGTLRAEIASPNVYLRPRR